MIFADTKYDHIIDPPPPPPAPTNPPLHPPTPTAIMERLPIVMQPHGYARGITPIIRCRGRFLTASVSTARDITPIRGKTLTNDLIRSSLHMGRAS
jgi:hypothetical protein